MNFIKIIILSYSKYCDTPQIKTTYNDKIFLNFCLALTHNNLKNTFYNIFLLSTSLAPKRNNIIPYAS